MKALIPAAGLGTRWYPWSKVIPKELLPLGRFPAIHYVLEEAVAAGIRDIGTIIIEAKSLIRAYADKIWKLDHPDGFINQEEAGGAFDARDYRC
jgi:UTP--glucose-1-phosphate uridylyltransferase